MCPASFNLRIRSSNSMPCTLASSYAFNRSILVNFCLFAIKLSNSLIVSVLVFFFANLFLPERTYTIV